MNILQHFMLINNILFNIMTQLQLLTSKHLFRASIAIISIDQRAGNHNYVQLIGLSFLPGKLVGNSFRFNGKM